MSTFPEIDIHYGHFLVNERMKPLVDLPSEGPRWVNTYHVGEKGSDVNLASYLLIDAVDDEFDTAFVVSNDSDLTTPIRIVRDRFDKDVVVLNPYKKHSSALRQVATNMRPVRERALRVCLLPNPLVDAAGREIHKPKEW